MKGLEAYITVGLLFFAAFSETAWAFENTNSPSNLPLSSRREGLISSPDTIDNSGNLLVTGNVRGGRYFRGVVPYRATTDFGVDIPSSSLDSFLRDSASSEDLSGYTAGYGSYSSSLYKPYYSPTQTVMTTMPGYSVAVTPLLMNVDGHVAQPDIAEASSLRLNTLSDSEAEISLSHLRPISMTTEEMERIILSEISKYPQPEVLTDQQYQDQVKQFRRDLKQVSEKVSELEQNLDVRDDFLLPPIAIKPPNDISQQFETPTQTEQTDEESAETTFIAPWALDKQLDVDVYEQMKQQLDSSQKGLELSSAMQQVEDTNEAAGEPAEEQTQEGSQTEKLADIDLLSIKAQGILGPFKTFVAYSEDRFNQHMRAAELYLKHGRYYRAADAYTLASLYKPDDPLAYAGKSHALFASGEYMSSALFLSRALQIFPEYAQFKIDIEAMIGDRGMLETRIADVEEWLEISGAPELQFLLAYVFYQMDRPQRAKEAVNAAYEKVPEAPAVLALKKAIEDSK